MSVLDRTHREISQDFFEFAFEVYELLRHFGTIEEFEGWLLSRTRPLTTDPYYLNPKKMNMYSTWGPFPNYSYPDENFKEEWKEMGSLENGDEKWWYVSRPYQNRHGYIVRNLWVGGDEAMQEWIMFTDQKLEWIQRHPSLPLNQIEYTLFENSTWETYINDRDDEYRVTEGMWSSMNRATVFFDIPKRYLSSSSLNYPQGGIT